MADFNQAVQKTLVHEGGYQNDPKDWANWRGGKTVMEKYLSTKDSSLLVNLIGTKYGITAQDMPELDANGMRNLTPEQATAYYQEAYWKQGYSQINNQLLAEKLFDMGVLFGVGTAVKLLQISMQHAIAVVSDGNFGPNTLNATNQIGDLNEYKQVLLAHIVNVVTNNPGDAVFVQGWTNRVNS